MTSDTARRWHPNVYSLAHSMAAAYSGAAPEPALTDQDRQDLADAIVPDIARGLGSLGLSHEDLGTYVGSAVVRWEKLQGRGEGARHFTVRSVDDVEVAPTMPGWKPSA